MRKKFVFYIINTVACAGMLLFAACSGVECPLNNTVYSTYGFYAFTDGGEASASILDTLTVKAAGTDSILLNRVLGKSEIELPVSYSAPVDTLIFEFTNVEQVLRRDTVWVMKENFPHYESPECPAAMFHVVTGVRSTHLLIDTVHVVNPNINYNASENFKIYFYTAD